MTNYLFVYVCFIKVCADFYKTDIYKQVIGHYDRVIEDIDKESQLDWWSQTRIWDSYKITSLEPFYYIWQVQQTAQSKPVLDYGCGPNEFKQFWPNIYGVDRLSLNLIGLRHICLAKTV